jgi:hypothetical protein
MFLKGLKVGNYSHSQNHTQQQPTRMIVEALNQVTQGNPIKLTKNTLCAADGSGI